MPADGRKLSRHDWPQCYARIGGAVWENGESFQLPTRPTEVVRDPASFAKIRRDFMVDVRTGEYLNQATKIDELDELRIR
jgi:hypothetical protein